MTVYVDDMYLYPMGRFGRMKMSHMQADTTEELHDMAASIGLRRHWFQNEGQGRWREHYDVSIGRRKRAIALGAKPVSMWELAEISRRWREEDRCHG